MFFNRNIKYFIMKINVDFIWPIGSYYETSNSSFNPNTSWGGIWVLETDGVSLVSKSNTSGSIFNTTIGSIDLGAAGGALARLNKEFDWANPANNNGMRETGGSKAHNNMPPYRAVYMWYRSA